MNQATGGDAVTNQTAITEIEENPIGAGSGNPPKSTESSDSEAPKSPEVIPEEPRMPAKKTPTASPAKGKIPTSMEFATTMADAFQAGIASSRKNFGTDTETKVTQGVVEPTAGPSKPVQSAPKRKAAKKMPGFEHFLKMTLKEYEETFSNRDEVDTTRIRKEALTKWLSIDDSIKVRSLNISHDSQFWVVHEISMLRLRMKSKYVCAYLSHISSIICDDINFLVTSLL